MRFKLLWLFVVVEPSFVGNVAVVNIRAQHPPPSRAAESESYVPLKLS